MNPRRRILTILMILSATLASGVTGYMVIEDYSFLNAVYMTVITVSTVGYQEATSLSSGGRVFSIVLIVFGVGGMLYTLTAVVQYLLEGNLASIWGRRRMKDRITKLKDHVVLCGYGLVGREVARVFRSEGVAFVVIEQDPEVIAGAIESGCLCMQGNATSDEVNHHRP